MTRDELLAVPNEKLRNGNISADYLVHMDCLDAPKNWWTGWGDLRTSGRTWQGIGDLISVSGLPMSYKPSADQATFKIASATKEMQLLARQSAKRVYGRAVTVSMQFFEVFPDAGQPWQPLGPAFTLYSGWMDQLTYKAARNEDGKMSRYIELTAEGVFVRRNAPANGRWTDADQKRRHPDDKGCERMPIYMNYSPIWTV